MADVAHGAELRGQSFDGLKVASAAHEVNNFAESLTNLVYLLQQNPTLDENSRKYVGQFYAGLGEKDEAFRLLEKGYEERSAGMLYLAVDPFWDNIRSDSRFGDLLRRMGLSQ